MRWLYNFILAIGLVISLPVIFWKFFKYKKYRSSCLERLGFNLPSFSHIPSGFRVWVHSVSLGETKACLSLIHQLQKEKPDVQIFFSASTKTGLEEGKKRLPSARSHFLLPIDFSWTMKRLFNEINPHLLILVESDFWYNLVTLAPLVILVNGKISEKSVKHFKFFSFFTQKLFSGITLFCVQSDLYKKRFSSLGISSDKIVVTGNLKLDQVIPKINQEEWRSKMGLSDKDRVITLGSTHAPEEEELLEALRPLLQEDPHLKVLLVPRHPERFPSVKALLEKKRFSFGCYSDPDLAQKHAQVVLVDTMGLLGVCYQLSDIAIVAGSFGSQLGGHNIFEPVSLGIPTLFGPYMQSQRDLVELILSSQAGIQVTLSTLVPIVKDFLRQPPVFMQRSALALASKMQGSTERTWKFIQPFF